MIGTARVDDTTNRLENLAQRMTIRNTLGNHIVTLKKEDRCRQMNQVTAPVGVKALKMTARGVAKMTPGHRGRRRRKKASRQVPIKNHPKSLPS